MQNFKKLFSLYTHNCEASIHMFVRRKKATALVFRTNVKNYAVFSFYSL